MNLEFWGKNLNYCWNSTGPLSEIKHNSYQRAQTQFWRTAKNANQIQAQWFEKLLNDKNYILLIAEFKNPKNIKKQLVQFIIGNIRD